MQQEIVDFLNKERICALSILALDNKPHIAAMHFSYEVEPFTLYFSTDNTTRKTEKVNAEGRSPAAVVIGFSETEWVSLQIGGNIETITDPEELKHAQEVHFAKNPHAAKYKDEPSSIIMKLTPSWWKYTDFKTHPETVFEKF